MCVGPKSNCASCRPFLRVGGNSLVLMPATATAAGSGKRQLRAASRMRHAAVCLTGKPHVPPLSADHMRLTRQRKRDKLSLSRESLGPVACNMRILQREHTHTRATVAAGAFVSHLETLPLSPTESPRVACGKWRILPCCNLPPATHNLLRSF